MSASVNRSGLGVGLFFFVLAWPVFGFWGDLAYRVNGDHQETLGARMAQWTSTIFHTAMAAGVAFASPMWGLVWGLFAAGVLMRRLGARRGFVVRAVPLVATLDVKLKSALGVFVALPVLAQLTGSGLLNTLAAFSITGLLVLTGVTASRFALKEQKDLWGYERWVLELTPVFNAGSNWQEDGGLAYYGDAGVVIDPVPSTIATRYDHAAMDAALANGHPELEIAPTSHSQRIIIDRATPATLERRAALKESGGLFAGRGEAVTSSSRPAVSDFNLPKTTQGDPLVISLEDL